MPFSKLLTRTSRTFGLAIPLLAEPLRHELTLAYLLFRVADTLEDADGEACSMRVQALAELDEAIATTDRSRHATVSQSWLKWHPTRHAGYEELIDQFPALMAAIQELPDPVRELLLQHASRTIRGMLRIVESAHSDGSVRLESLDELRAYCYTVAGIVGELITELFVHQVDELSSVADELRANAAAFGEGLQLVNILKDGNDDAAHGRVYLPATVQRESVFALAREDLECAQVYVDALERTGAGRGLAPFTRFPVLLACLTLDRVERMGAGAKLSRAEVANILHEVDPQAAALLELSASRQAKIPEAQP